MDIGLEREVRDAAFEHLRAVVDDHGVADWADLKRFEFRGERVFLVGSGNGIFKPRQLDLPISILTAAPSDRRDPPYPDEISDDDYLLYRYRGEDPQHPDNVRLRELARVGLPLIYLHGIQKGRYLASGAVLIDDSPAELTFLVALTELSAANGGLGPDSIGDVQRRSQLRLVEQRVDQASFRERVLRAYRTSCALCRIRHSELLDAAHIVPHSQGGLAVVPNGLSLCKIHHAAYDANILGVRPDLTAEIRADVLAEHDGPMLAHGLQMMHGSKLLRPRSAADRPDPSFLEERYERFKAAG